jgi:hypothetical protein
LKAGNQSPLNGACVLKLWFKSSLAGSGVVVDDQRIEVGAAALVRHHQCPRLKIRSLP